MSTVAEHVDDFEYELTPLENMILFFLVFDKEKAERRKRFFQSRRQDHGTRGNSCEKGENRRYGNYYWRGDEEVSLAVKRRIFLRGGVPEFE